MTESVNGLKNYYEIENEEVTQLPDLPDLTIPLHMAWAIFPAPMNPTMVSVYLLPEKHKSKTWTQSVTWKTRGKVIE